MQASCHAKGLESASSCVFALRLGPPGTLQERSGGRVVTQAASLQSAVLWCLCVLSYRNGM